MSEVKVVRTWDELPPVIYEAQHAKSQAYSTRVLEQKYRRLEGLNHFLVETLRNLKREHETCEDPWYSCPKSGNCVDDRQDSNICTCGADKTNEIICAAIAKAIGDNLTSPSTSE